MTAERLTVVVVGGGPAGLTAGYLLCQRGFAPLVLEADPERVGGISRTVEYKGYFFDIGGHRFFSKSADIDRLWTEMLPDDMLVRRRKSRIFYGGKFFDYPLKPVSALRTLGLTETVSCGFSFMRARLLPVRAPQTFEDWVVNQFGRRLFEIFFKSYTEKVWGISCSELSADWAAQRIKGLSVGSILRKALPWPQGGRVVKTLVEQFRYPRKGPGMLWEACADKINGEGGRVALGRKVTGLTLADGKWQVRHRGRAGDEQTEVCDHVLCSAPVGVMVAGLSPAPAPEVLAAAEGLKHRDFLTVALIVRDRQRFDDNWIYVQDPGVTVGRIQNFKAWSPEMIPDPETNCFGLEYFCNAGDQLWSMADDELVRLAVRELDALGLGEKEDFLDGCVVRQRYAYPVYDDGYAANIATLRKAVDDAYPGLHLIGRNGMHRYNNQDHSMMTAMLAVENIVSGKPIYDVWNVNQDAEYHETS